MRLAARPFLLAQQQALFLGKWSAPMASSAQAEMKAFWNKNLKLGRPNSPWIVYEWHLPMMTSLAHRFTGIAMGVTLYLGAVGITAAPGDFTGYVEFLKNLQLSPLVWFPIKSICAFPLVYHYVNGIRHLFFDSGYGYKLKTQYKTGIFVFSLTGTVAMLLASISYW